MPEISIIVPIYNAENFLHYCIDSILKQTYNNFELLLVDDGSPDNSGKICDEYAKKDHRVTVIHKENGGVSSARNAGIEVAEGEYICFVDSDDYLEEDYLSGLIGVKNCYSDIDNVWCGFQTVEDYNKKNAAKVVASDICEMSFYNIKQIMSLHEKWLDPMPWNKLYYTRIIIDNNIRFPLDLSLGEDFLFNLEYLDHTNGEIVIINKPLYNYIRNGKESLDNKYYSNLLEIYKRIDEFTYEYARKWNLDEEQFSKIYNSAFYKYEVVMRNTFSKENNESYLSKIKYNNKILRSEDFIECINKMNGSINSLYMFAYKSKNYILVLCVDGFVKIFSKIKKQKTV